MKVLLIGDGCIDKFVYCDQIRLNPEFSSLVAVPKYTVINGGMVNNVAAHFANLNIDYDLFTNEETITKTRYVSESDGAILLRVDEGDNSIKSKPPLIDFDKYSFFILSDYAKNYLTEDYIEYVVNYAALQNKPVFLDTKKVLGGYSYNAWVKINKKEYDFNIKNNAHLNREKLIVTLGRDGAQYKDNIIRPDKEINNIFCAGAGDSFMVFFAIYYYKTLDVIYSIRQANYFAGIACSSKGVVSDFSQYYLSDQPC